MTVSRQQAMSPSPIADDPSRYRTTRNDLARDRKSLVMSDANLQPTSAQASPGASTETTQSRDKRSPASVTCQPNIVIFGETGVGKSSIINLISGEHLAQTSNSARGCTFQHQQYNLSIDEINCSLWDTTGLDEGTAGAVPAAQAETNLKTLIQTLSNAGGINLVVYCVRAGRVTQALRRNYDIFYSKVCRKKVPVMLIVTHLEYQEGTMETWWDTNEKDILEQGMRFDTHACITTLHTHDPDVQERRLYSRKILREHIVAYSQRPPWRIDDSFMSAIFPMFRNLFRPSPSNALDGKTHRTVVVYDPVQDYYMESPPGFPTWWQRSTCFIGGRRYDFIRTSALDTSIKLQAAGLLIFYTSPVTDAGISRTDEEALEKFYAIAGGWMCPMIVVLRGCEDEGAAQTCWDTHHRLAYIRARPTIFPTTAHRPSYQLMGMVETLWVEPPSVKSSPIQKAWTTIVGAVKGETQKQRQEPTPFTKPGQVMANPHLNGQGYPQPDADQASSSGQQNKLEQVTKTTHKGDEGYSKSDNGDVLSSSNGENEVDIQPDAREEIYFEAATDI